MDVLLLYSGWQYIYVQRIYRSVMECLRRLHGNVHSAIFRPRRGARCKRITSLPNLAVCQMAALCARTLPDRSVQSIFFSDCCFPAIFSISIEAQCTLL